MTIDITGRGVPTASPVQEGPREIHLRRPKERPLPPKGPPGRACLQGKFKGEEHFSESESGCRVASPERARGDSS